MASYDNGGVGWGSGLDWDMTSNQGLTPLVNYNFNLQVEGIYNLPCKSVHVFHRENEYETYQEGGLNDYVHMLRKPISKPMTFQVERYVGIDMLDPLALGTDLVLPVLLLVSRYQGDGDNGVLDLSDSMQRGYTFTGCTVISKEYGELNAERSGLLVETTTIAYREMICVDNPSTKSKRASWSMKKDYANMERDAERKLAKSSQHGIEELTKEDMEANAMMYIDRQLKNEPVHIQQYKGRKIPDSIRASGTKKMAGIAEKKDMIPREEREKAAVRYYMPGAKGRQSYKGRIKASATVNKEELSRKQMENLARNGGAVKKQMKTAPKQRRYFIKGSISKDQYQGKIAGSAIRTEDEKSQTQREGESRMYVLKGSKNHEDFKGTKVASAMLIGEEKRKAELEAAARKGGAEKRTMSQAKGQRRYFIAGSGSKNSYTGTIQKSAVHNSKELSKEKMQEKARKWPQTRSAADVAAFLKKK